MRSQSPSRVIMAVTVAGALAGCGGDNEKTPSGGAPVAQTLFVAHEGFLVSYDVATGRERPGTIPNVTGPVDIQAFSDGHLMVNLTGRNEVLVVDGRTMLEKARIRSSGRGGQRPVHSYVSPELDGRRVWLTLNDGSMGMPATNSALFVDCHPASATYHQTLGEVPLGVGHHKAAFSATRPRVVISNISDCDDVLSVYDYANLMDVKRVATLTAKDAGWDGSSFARACDPSYQKGVPPAPHGCATSPASKKAYCNLTGSGELVAIAIDEPTPTFRPIATTGAGGGYTKASRDGRYIYALQGEPREGSMRRPGAPCQVGQLVVLDATTDVVVREVPLLYRGPGCTTSITGTPAETNEPGHIALSPDGRTLFVAIGGGFMVESARSNQHLAVDVSDPRNARLVAAIEIGAATGHRADTVSGDGKSLFVTNNVDGTVSQIDVATSKVVRTIKTKDKPLTVATWGTAEGASEQTGPTH